MNYSVFVTRKIPQPGIEILKQNCQVVDINPEDRPLSKDEIIEGVKGRDGVLCLLTDTIDQEILKSADKARIFANYAVGYNNIDIKAATNQGIMVTNTPGVLTQTTADLTWALLLAAARRICESDTFTRAGKFQGWGPMLLLGREVTGSTLGIIGAGRIGTAVAMRAKGFDMNILYCDTRENHDLESNLDAVRVSLEEILKQSDFICLHPALTHETIHLIGSKELKLMKPTAILINTSRGQVVDEKALVCALKSGEIAGAGLDVYENEPALETGLTDLPNVVLTPHTGSATQATRTRMAVMAAENLIKGLKGEKPPNLVNPEVLE